MAREKKNVIPLKEQFIGIYKVQLQLSYDLAI